MIGAATTLFEVKTAEALLSLDSITVSSFDFYDSDLNFVETKNLNKIYNLYARLPYITEISTYDVSKNNAYLYDNLHTVCYFDVYQEISCSDLDKYEDGYVEGLNVEGLDHVKGVDGYWLNESYAGEPMYYAWLADFAGAFSEFYVDDESDTGVRPVITVPVNRIIQKNQ